MAQAEPTAELPVVDAAGRAGRVLLEPFSGIHDKRYTVYWPVGDPARRHRGLRALDLAAAAQGQIVDTVIAGEQQPESDHHFAGEATRAGGADGIHWRSATGWFSYILADPDRRAQVLRVRFRQVRGRGHELRLDGALLDEPLSEWEEGSQLVSDYALPISRCGQSGDGSLHFGVHALPGCSTGDLLSVQLVRTC